MIKRTIIRNGKKYIVNTPSWDEDVSWGDQVGTGSIPCISPFIIKNPIPQIANAPDSGSIIFTVVAAPAGPFDNITYQWKNGINNVVDGQYITGSRTYKLILNQVDSMAFQGFYSVIVTTNCGTTQSLQAFLTIANGGGVSP